MQRAVLVSLCALALGCVDVATLDDYPCPDAGTALSYDSFGKPFLDEWCNECHSAPSGDRQGAPDDVRFDAPSGVTKWRDRIFERAALSNDSMPPGPDDP